MALFKKSAKVQWKWLGHTINGTVEEVFKVSVTKTIKGKNITRHGTDEKPAYLVKSEAGNLALKLETELLSGKSKVSSAVKPKMFK
jgi:hypothetical protein